MHNLSTQLSFGPPDHNPREVALPQDVNSLHIIMFSSHGRLVTNTGNTRHSTVRTSGESAILLRVYFLHIKIEYVLLVSSQYSCNEHECVSPGWKNIWLNGQMNDDLQSYIRTSNERKNHNQSVVTSAYTVHYFQAALSAQDTSIVV